MIRELRFLDPAISDVREADAWYEDKSRGLGNEFIANLELCLHEIATRPLTFPVVAPRARRALIKRFPYCVYFAVQESDVIVFAVVHGRRNPVVWQSRVLN